MWWMFTLNAVDENHFPNHVGDKNSEQRVIELEDRVGAARSKSEDGGEDSLESVDNIQESLESSRDTAWLQKERTIREIRDDKFRLATMTRGVKMNGKENYMLLPPIEDGPASWILQIFSPFLRWDGSFNPLGTSVFLFSSILLLIAGPGSLAWWIYDIPTEIYGHFPSKTAARFVATIMFVASTGLAAIPLSFYRMAYDKTPQQFFCQGLRNKALVEHQYSFLINGFPRYFGVWVSFTLALALSLFLAFHTREDDLAWPQGIGFIIGMLGSMPMTMAALGQVKKARGSYLVPNSSLGRLILNPKSHPPY